MTKLPVLLLVSSLGLSLVACKKEAPAVPLPAAPAMPPPAATPEPVAPTPAGQAQAGPAMDTPVLLVFSGNDAHAMAGLGHELESRRPPLTLNVLKQMLALMRKDPGQDEQVRKMRPLLFRSAAVIIGRPALPLLSDCVATVKELSQLCGGALQEIEAAK
jgi:hypothetical protein